MAFGYIGYIWTLCGCAGVSVLLLGAAGVLYAVARKDGRGAPRTLVEPVGGETPRGPTDGGGGSAA